MIKWHTYQHKKYTTKTRSVIVIIIEENKRIIVESILYSIST